MSSSNISDEELLRLWRDPNFSGSYRGAKTVQVLLKTDLGIDVSQHRLYRVFKNDPIFLIHQMCKDSRKERLPLFNGTLAASGPAVFDT